MNNLNKKMTKISKIKIKLNPLNTVKNSRESNKERFSLYNFNEAKTTIRRNTLRIKSGRCASNGIALGENKSDLILNRYDKKNAKVRENTSIVISEGLRILKFSIFCLYKIFYVFFKDPRIKFKGVFPTFFRIKFHGFKFFYCIN